MEPNKQPPGSERARDEERHESTARYAGGPWRIADQRGEDRYGHARTDDADPSELGRGEAENDDDESPSAVDPDLAAAEEVGEIESGGEQAGMGRGEKPRKPKSRTKRNPRTRKATKKSSREKQKKQKGKKKSSKRSRK